MTNVGTYHEGIAHNFRKRADNDPRWSSEWLRCAGLLKDGFFDEWYKAVFFQPYGTRNDIWQVAAFAEIHTAVIADHIEIAPICNIGQPFPNDAKDENNHLLSRLPYPFRAEFIGQTNSVGDGSLGWNVDIQLGEHLYAPKDIALEVGYTQATTVLWHLGRSNWLARWPYGQGMIYVIHVLDRAMFGAVSVL